MGVSYQNSSKSKEDQTHAISKSVFVTNFPDHFSARDLWNVCLVYGMVIDVFISFKRSKAGKKFAFVVDNLDRLIGNLCTIWIGSFKLHANTVRFHREPKPNGTVKPKVPSSQNQYPSFPKKNVSVGTNHKSFATALSNGIENPTSVDETPALVLDDSCLL
ncbi:RNA-directed DNA polymerase, eukaryota, partial [Tanacetum coccineum]